MHSEAAGAKRRQAGLDEAHPVVEGAQMFQRAGRPAKVEAGQIVGDGVHVDGPEADQRAGVVVGQDRRAQQVGDAGGVLAAGCPALGGRGVTRRVGRRHGDALPRQPGRQRFASDAEAERP